MSDEAATVETLRRERDAARAERDALAEVMRVINAHPGEPGPVFETILERSARLCGVAFGLLFTWDGQRRRTVAAYGLPEPFATYTATHPVLDGLPPLSQRMVAERRTLEIPDAALGEGYLAGHPSVRALVDLGGARTTLQVPLLKGEDVIGYFSLYRQEVRTFAAPEIALLKSFAAQAVIAFENARLLSEQREALARQTAMAEVLEVVNRSVGDPLPVFEAILAKAHSVCGADVGALGTMDGEVLQARTVLNYPAEIGEQMLRRPMNPAWMAAFTAGVRHVHVPDGLAPDSPPEWRRWAEESQSGIRTMLGVAMRRDDKVVGLITAHRKGVRPYSGSEIALLESFADQAVIAMENARLISEQREALARQTAMVEVLATINGSIGEIEPVFEAILDRAMRLCSVSYGSLYTFDSEQFVAGAHRGYPAQFIAYRSHGPIRPTPGSIAARLVEARAPVQTADITLDPVYIHGTENDRAIHELGGVRAMLLVPLLRSDGLAGMITLSRREPRPFSPEHVAVAESFAAQAVVAIENARLINEQRNALARQTAIADVLAAINANPGNLAPVFDAMLERAHALCDAEMGALKLFDGQRFIGVATHGYPAGLDAWVRAAHVPTPYDRQLLDGARLVQVDDLEGLAQGEGEGRIISFGRRAALAVPMRKDGVLLGLISAYRREVRAFSEQEVQLLESFAAQAVIAIENARLLEALRGRTSELAARNSAFAEQVAHQVATIDVLKVLSASPGDARRVFETILDRAIVLSNASFGGLFEYDGHLVRIGIISGVTPDALAAHQAAFPMPPSRDYIVNRTILDARTYYVRDLAAEQGVSEGARSAGERSLVTVPLLRDGRAVGALSICHSETDAFSPAQIALLETFAEQAVIAIGTAATFQALQQRTAELTEALEMQTATSDVLSAISRSAFDLDTVLMTLIDTALRLCDATYGEIFRRDGEVYRLSASCRNTDPEYLKLEQQAAIRPGRGTLIGRVALEGKTVEIPDAWEDPEYDDKEAARIGGVRSMLGVPLLRDGQPIGAFALARTELTRFSRRQIELITTFADQAVIAYENARLFAEVQARTAELSESLAMQTATADVLKAISRSAFDLDVVLTTLIRTATGLCDTSHGQIFRLEDGAFVYAASVMDLTPEYLEIEKRQRIPPGRGTLVGRAALERQTVHIADVLADPDYAEKDAARIGGIRTVLGVPMLRDGEVIGVFTIARQEVRPFSRQQIELVTTFADQAVIALENARLFAEVQSRTAELTESLEMQTATADVLKAISRTAFDLDTVLETLTRSAATLCGADTGNLRVRDGEGYRLGASFGFAPEGVDYLRSVPLRPGRGSISARVAQSLAVEMVEDEHADPDLDPALLQATPNRAVLGVPLLRDGRLEGVFVLGRTEPGRFTQRQVEVVQTFADQAVIAVQNARLFKEVQARTADLADALDMQSATSDVLKAISRSAFDLDTVLDTLTRSAMSLCRADTASLRMRHGDFFTYRTAIGLSEEYMRFAATLPVVPGRRSLPMRVVESLAVVHLPDIEADPELDPEIKRTTPNKAALGVPLLRDGRLEGIFNIGRVTPGAFTDRQIALVQTFADQALIAIENARLFQEVQSRTEELSRSLTDLRAAQDRLVQTEKLASLGQLTAGIAHEIKNPLNFVNNFSALSVELLDELQEVLAPVDGAVRAEVDELVGMLKGNLDKVVGHGRRADGIVKNMLLHSREKGGERRAVDFNAVVEEALNLAYHGARAETPGFNITLERRYDPAIGMVELFPQEFTRVMLNLIGNGFYAATRRKAAGEAGFEPVLSVATQAAADGVVVRVRDNGVGISEAVRARLFEPFFTTKPAGEGTGLGLSLSHDIVVKQHGGTIAMESVPGDHTVFTVTIPRRLPGEGA